MASTVTPDGAGLIVCPICDALHTKVTLEKGDVARCQRCHAVIATPRRKAGMQIIALSVASLILAIGAMVFPFLRIEARGLQNSASVLDVALSFGDGYLSFLVVATAALVIILPALRMILLIYVITPLVFDHPPAEHARPAFRVAQKLEPWAMAEIFALGCAVSLVKLGDLAQVELGPAFWMFAGLVLLTLFKQHTLCNWSVWNALAPARS